MTQSRFRFGTVKREKPVSKQRDQYDTANLRAAHEIADDPTLWGGKESFGYVWAMAVIERLESAGEKSEAA
jgi:hypothetical protein